MGKVRETAASLRISGLDLLPDDVSSLLGRQPDLGYRRGDPMPLPDGRFGAPARLGMWSISADRARPGNLDAQVAELLATVTSDLSIWNRIASMYDIDLFCGLFIADGNQGLTLSVTTLQNLSVRGIELDLDIYLAR